MKHRLHLHLGIAVLVSAAACATNPRHRLDGQPDPALHERKQEQDQEQNQERPHDTSLEFTQNEYAESRAELLKTSIASHFNILFGAGSESLPSDTDLRILDDALDEARRAVVRAHDQNLSVLEAWTKERLKKDFPSGIEVALSTDAFANVEPRGRIRLSVGFLRAQVHGAVAHAVGDEPDDHSAYAELTDAIMVMLRADQFEDFHTLHDLKWRDSSGAGFTALWTRLTNAAYRAGLWFVVAHEMGHLAMGDADRELDCMERQEAELAADRYATAVLGFALTKEDKDAASIMLGQSSERDTRGAGGYDYFFLVGYPEVFSSRPDDGCPIHAPAGERAELIRPIAARTLQSRSASATLDSLKATHEEWAPGVTAAVGRKCSIDEYVATQKIKGTVDALLGLFTGAPIQIGLEPEKKIVQRILGLIEEGETPDCEGPFLFELQFRNK